MIEMMRGGMAVENVRIFRGALYISEDGERARKESQGQRCRKGSHYSFIYSISFILLIFVKHVLG